MSDSPRRISARLPTIALALIPLGVIARVVRSAALDILAQEFVLALRAKGLAHRRVFTHVVKNAAPQIITVLGLQFGFLVGGTIVVETVFAVPGTGQLLVSSISGRDYPVVQAITVISAFLVILVNLVVDLSYSVLDPRVTYE